MSGYGYRPPPREGRARGGYASSSASRLDATTTNTLTYMTEEQKEKYREERAAAEKKAAQEKRQAEIIENNRKQAEENRKVKERIENARKRELAKAKAIAPDYRREYNEGDPQSFNDAKKAADETYMQFWYDKANAITDKWTDADYALLVEPKYKTVKVYSRRNNTEDVRVYPKGYDEFLEIKENIDYGVLDFTSEKDHKKLIGPPSNRGYGKYQSWISKDDPLRQAVDAQSAVMKEWLDEANVDLVIPYSELDGFNRPDPMRGEGLYLNTGTGAHINWDSGRLKRMQSYRNVGGDEGGFGEYSTAFIRPDPDYGAFGKVLTVVGTLTGNPVMRNIGVLAQGGDWKDLAKSYVANQVTAPILEDTFASLGVDAELLGIDPDTFSDSLMDVQTTMIEGGSGTDALINEFTEPVAERVADVAKEALPDVDLGIDIDFDTPDIIKDIGNAVVAVAEPILATAEDVVKPVIDLAQTVTEPVVDVVKEVAPVVEDVVLDPVKNVIQTVTEPVVDVVKEVAPVVEDVIIDPIKQGVETTVDTIAEIGEPVIDTIDDALDAFGSGVVDPILQTGSDLLSDAEDVVSDVLSEGEDILKEGGRWLDDLIDWDSLAGGMFADSLESKGLQGIKPTATESLFDKELFKFDTEIKSTQEMLSPMMNSRRYG